MATSTDTTDTGAGNNVDLLEDVSLGFFTATPSAIGPFDSSVLAWHVDGMKPGVHVRLDTSDVAAVGQRTVQPQSTATYRLSAVAGSARKTLGVASVTVDNSTCGETEILNAFGDMKNLLFSVIADGPDTYWSNTGPQYLSVEPQGNQIAAHMTFRLSVPYVPDLWVTLDASFGLAVQNGKFVAINETATGSAEWPTWFGFLTGILGGFALALNDANAKATAKAHDVVTGLVALLNGLLLPDRGKRVRSVQVGRHADGTPFITYVQCAYTPVPPPFVTPDGAVTE